MFDPAPEYVADKQENKTQAYDFLIRVRNAALHYEVYGDNRIELINKCCDYLENLQDRLHTKIWPKGQREPIEEFQDVFQLLIYAIADSGFLFNSNGYFFDEPAEYHTEKLLLPSPWDHIGKELSRSCIRNEAPKLCPLGTASYSKAPGRAQ